MKLWSGLLTFFQNQEVTKKEQDSLNALYALYTKNNSSGYQQGNSTSGTANNDNSNPEQFLQSLMGNTAFIYKLDRLIKDEEKKNDKNNDLNKIQFYNNLKLFIWSTRNISKEVPIITDEIKTSKKISYSDTSYLFDLNLAYGLAHQLLGREVPAPQAERNQGSNREFTGKITRTSGLPTSFNKLFDGYNACCEMTRFPVNSEPRPSKASELFSWLKSLLPERPKNKPQG